MDRDALSNKLGNSPSGQEGRGINTMTFSKAKSKDMAMRGAIMWVNDILLNPKKENK